MAFPNPRDQSPLLAAPIAALAPGALAPLQALLRPRTDFWALLESAGLWLGAVLAGLVVMLAMLLALQRTEAQLFRDARLVLALQEMREAVESELVLGLELADIAQTRQLLDNALLGDPSLLSSDVMDAQGLLLFSTDRGLVGEFVPPALIVAAQQQTQRARHSSYSSSQSLARQAYWSAPSEDGRTLGLAIGNSFAQTVGYISVSTLPVETTRPVWMGWAALGLITWIALLAALTARQASRRDYQASSQALALQQAAAVLHKIGKRQEVALARLIADQEQAS